MVRTKKHKRAYTVYEDIIEDDLFYCKYLQNSQCSKNNEKVYSKSPLSRSDTTHCQCYSVDTTKMHAHMKPRNIIQSQYINSILDTRTSIVLATGPAGTGKSAIAVSCAIDLFNKGLYERIVITRPAVTVDESHGFLPGKIEDKLDPWVRPLYDTFYKYFSPDQVKSMIAQKTIDICPLAYLRGRTLENSFIIVDEAQNCSMKQMLMVLTRIGSGSKMVITGDPSQHDRGREMSGLVDLIERYYKKQKKYTIPLELSELSESADICTDLDGIAHIQFTSEHIERHPIIKKILDLYE